MITKADIDLKVLTFSTNNEKKNTFSILKDFFISSNCSRLRSKSNNHIQFHHTLKNYVQFRTELLEITDYTKDYEFNQYVDTILVFIDLEDPELKVKLNSILAYLYQMCDLGKYNNLVGIFFIFIEGKNMEYMKDIKKKVNNKMKEYFKGVEDMVKFVKLNDKNSYDSIITEAINNKADKEGIFLSNNNMCESNCLII